MSPGSARQVGRSCGLVTAREGMGAGFVVADSEAVEFGCTHHHGTWECRGDGYLWDADSDGYDPADHSHPCPGCNTEAFLREEKDTAEGTSYIANNYTMAFTDKGYMSGVDIWDTAVAVALEANPNAANAALKAIGTASPIMDADNEEGFVAKQYVY